MDEPDRLPHRCRWECDADGKGGVVRQGRSLSAFYLFGVAWNVALPLVTSGHDPSKPNSGVAFAAIGFCAAVVFAYLAVRSFVNRTSVRFLGGKLFCRTGPLPPRKAFEHEASDIAGFVADRGVGKSHDGFVVSLVTRNNHRIPLPLDLDGLVVTVNVLNRAIFGRAPVEHAAYVARRLDEALEVAQHEGGRYRVAPGAEGPGELTPRGDDDREVLRRSAGPRK